MSFFDRREVRDILAYLKLLDSPDDEVSLRRIINTPPRGIGPSTVEKLTERAVEAGVPLWKLLGNRSQQLGLSVAANEAIARFVGEMTSLHEMMQAASEKGRATRSAGGSGAAYGRADRLQGRTCPVVRR
jgi:DNA helicase-2/ATP-dependent DNA helicase PcrA